MLDPLRSSAITVLVASLVGGCVVPLPVGGSTDSDAGSSSGDANASSGSGAEPGTQGDGIQFDLGGADDGIQFDLGGADDGIQFDLGGISSCDLWLQDCPPGEKCMPYANDGGNAWNDARCSPIVDDPAAVGEPCTVQDSGTSGLDTCALGAMCWAVDPETLEGTCTALCTGTPARPACEPADTTCAMGNDGTLAVCLANCDPVLADCPAGQSCFPSSDVFVCVPAGGIEPVGPGEPCADISQCDSGSACIAAAEVPGCADPLGCCSPFCNVDDPLPPCLAGQVCTAWYDEGAAPAGYEHVGVCTIPT